MERRSLMVILAHPDDESFPIGGTLAMYAAQGASITLVTATNGQHGIPGLTPLQAGEVRVGELYDAAAALRIAEVRLLGYMDGELEQAVQDEVRRRLRALMITHRPDAVITFGPDGISGHVDHLAIHRLATEAFDAAALPDARLYYIAPSEATRQGCGVNPSAEVAGGTVAAIDIGPHREAKLRAMQCHASQHPPFGGPPAEEAGKLACHEYFTLARPSVLSDALACLFAPLNAPVPA
ncbi:MAG TPA: PIG-L family deacetylase [Chloroflexaceae bacterium]|nr:PIG-L family deacetylase [Chloroflexaceae bacterium]